MKILISAFNCHPYKGSEEGLGWAWVRGLSQMGHQVWVITIAENQSSIDQELSANPVSNLHFFYHELVPYSSSWWMFESHRFGMLTQLLDMEWRWFRWQWGAYRLAKSLTEQVAFDYVQHVTNTSVRRYSFMGFLGIPFILGPLAGGVRAPWPLRKSYPFMGQLLDLSRDLANVLVKFNPLLHLTFAKASKIYCDSQQTQAVIPGFYRSKSQILFYIATPEIFEIPKAIKRKPKEKEIFRVLFVGRLVYWKGLHLGLKAFAQLQQKMPGSRLTAIGEGSDAGWLQGLAEQLGISNAVEWVPWMAQKEVFKAYLQYDVLLIPTLHDTGPYVILEAFSCGLPVICLDLGGPGVMVDESCGRVIKTDRLREEAVIQALSDALMELATNPDLQHQLSKGALARTSQFMWKDVLEAVYTEGSSEVLFNA
jgi:glycosyltransferase involved in cell wall biosynthesis